MNMNYEILGQRLRLARERSRISQTEAAQVIDVTAAALNQYESGKRRVDALTLERLSRLYGVPLRSLFGEETVQSDWEEALRLNSETILSHHKLGNIIAINQTQTETRLSFSLAHGLAHRLYQYDQPAILCHHGVTNPLECFAEKFAAYFLIPSAALQERLHSLGIKRVRHPAEVVHLAHYFGVSYEEMLIRLDWEHQLAGSQEDFKQIQPEHLSRNLGYSSFFEESGEGFLPVEKRLPRIFLELAYRAVLADKLSLRRVAEMLGISDIELEDRLFMTEQTLEEIAS